MSGQAFGKVSGTIRSQNGMRSQRQGGSLIDFIRLGNSIHYGFTIVVMALAMVAIDYRSTAAEVEYILENYNYLLTYQDCGFNQFGGNTGGLNSDNLSDFAICDRQTQTHRFVSDSADGEGRSLRLALDFPDSGGFFGIFHSLAGLTDTLVTFDGTTVISLSFPDFTLDLDHFFGSHAGEPVVSLDVLQFRTQHNSPADGRYRIKVILKDSLN
jgi:hypothetical protein